MSGKALTGDFLNEMRKSGDPLADATIEKLFTGGEGRVMQVNELLRHLIANDGVTSPELPAAIGEYLEQSGVLPLWADRQRLQRGQEIFEDFGLIAFSLLGCASLPECYSAGDAAKVLWLTQRLEKHVTRRIVETAQMVIDVMSKGGLSPGGKGIRAAQKVRLMHAAVRNLVGSDPEAAKEKITPQHFDQVLTRAPWDTDNWGVPINQSVMAGTLLTFSYVILRGLRKFGANLTEQQENDYLHVWNVVGFIMGVDEEFLLSAETYPDAERLFNQIIDRNRVNSVEAEALTQAIVDFMEGIIKDDLPLGRILPVRHIPKMLIVEMVGEKAARNLGIHLNWKDKLGLIPLGIAMSTLGILGGDAYHDKSNTHRVAEWIFRKMAKVMWELPRGGERELFFIPTQLADGWGLT